MNPSSASHMAAAKAAGAAPAILAPGPELADLFRIVRRATGVDFSGYKPAGVKRRIERRMLLKKIEKWGEYLGYLRGHPEEVEALFQGILIGVTGFFRDPQAFESLKKIAFPELFKNRAPTESVRVWVPGCSTGEEAYSHAICLLEYMAESKLNIPVQVFGTDVNESAINKARDGIFKANITADVSPARLQRFFRKVENGYQINRSIRNLCIFSRQNVISDPPFSKMDIVSCRNLLIYLAPALQRQLIATLHYALKPNGYLLLGRSEGLVGGGTDLFKIVDEKNRLYGKRPVRSPVFFAITTPDSLAGQVPVWGGKKSERKPYTAQNLADQILLAKYGPAAVVVDEKLDIVQRRGDISPYFELAPDKSLNLCNVAHPEILPPLQKAIGAARKGDVSIAKEQLEVSRNGNLRLVNLDVIPFKAASNSQMMYLVVFTETRR